LRDESVSPQDVEEADERDAGLRDCITFGSLRLRCSSCAETCLSISVLPEDESRRKDLCMVGYALEKMGKSDQAVQYYSKALKLKP